MRTIRTVLVATGGPRSVRLRMTTGSAPTRLMSEDDGPEPSPALRALALRRIPRCLLVWPADSAGDVRVSALHTVITVGDEGPMAALRAASALTEAFGADETARLTGS